MEIYTDFHIQLCVKCRLKGCFRGAFIRWILKSQRKNAIVTWGISSANLPSDRQIHFRVYHYINTEMDGLSESHQCRPLLILKRICIERNISDYDRYSTCVS